MSIEHLDAIWNRADSKTVVPAARAGDRALAALLLAHGLVMNSGVSHAVEALATHELEAAIEAYRFFGLHDIGKLLERAASVTFVDVTIADERYAAVIPADSALFDRFVATYTVSRSLFAPL